MELIEFLAGNEHDVEIRDMHDPAVAAAARSYGIRRVPAIVIDGRLADFYAARDLDEVTLTQVGAPAKLGGNSIFCPSPRGPGGARVLIPSIRKIRANSLKFYVCATVL